MYLSLISLAEKPELWDKYHDENLLFTQTDFAQPNRSALFAEVKSIGPEHRRLAEALQSASQKPPSATPALPELVSAKSKLPEWMVERPAVTVVVKTREAPPTQQQATGTYRFGGFTPVPHPITVVKPGSTPSPTRQPVPAPVPAPPPASGPITTPGTHPPLDWSKVIPNALTSAFGFAIVGLLLIWLWLPLLTGIYGGLGAGNDDASALAWLSYVCVSLFYGFRLAIREHRKSSTTPRVSHPTPYRPPLTPSPAPIGAGPLVGSRIRLIYHRPSCEWARKISSRNRISFASIANAQAQGYRRCRVCLP